MFLDDRTTLSPQTILTGKKSEYCIEKFLGLGLTAQVYRAVDRNTDRPVALKVLRHDASEKTQDFFWTESYVLNELSGIEAVPQVRDSQRDGEIKFLVLDYIDPERYQSLTHYPRPIEEKEALEISRQVLEVFVVLHDKVGRAYTDMQLQNFRWDPRTKTLKILDWNHVSTQRDYIQLDELQYFGVRDFEGLARCDLTRWGMYLYYLLTDKGVSEKGEPAWLLERRAGEAWSRLSLATRQLLIRALHPNADKRYRSAQEFLDQVKQIQAWWTEELHDDEEKLLSETIEQVSAARLAHPPDLSAYDPLDNIAAQLDVYARRGLEWPGLQRRIQDLIRDQSATWGKGWQYYQAELYQTALATWLTEAEQDSRPKLWRWVMLARTGVTDTERFQQIRLELEKVVGTLEAFNWEEAYRQWKRAVEVAPWLSDEQVPAHWIGVELEALRIFQTGEMYELTREWDKAAKAFQEVLQKIKTIPYGDRVCLYYGWEKLEERIEGNERRFGISSTFNKLTEQLRDNFSQGRCRVEIMLRWAPDESPLLDLCLKAGRDLRVNGRLQEALELIDTALMYGDFSHSSEIELDLKQLREGIIDSLYAKSWLSSLNIHVEEENWNLVSEYLSEVPDALRYHEEYQNIIDKIKRKFKFYLGELGNLERARQIAPLIPADIFLSMIRDITESIESAIEEGKWDRARDLALILSECDRQYYQDLVKSLQEKYQSCLESWGLESAYQIHEILTLLGDEATQRALELSRRKEALQEEIRQLQSQQEIDALLHHFADEAERKYRDFLARESSCNTIDDYEWILQDLDAEFERWKEVYTKVSRAELYLHWFNLFERYRRHLQLQIDWLKKMLEVTRLVDEAQKKADEFTEASLRQSSDNLRKAREVLEEIEDQLDEISLNLREGHYRATKARIEILESLLKVITEKNISDNLQQAIAYKNEFMLPVDGSTASYDVRQLKFRAWWDAWNLVVEQFGASLWPQAKVFFNTLQEMDEALARVREERMAFTDSTHSGPLEVRLESKDWETFQEIQHQTAENITSSVAQKSDQILDRIKTLETTLENQSKMDAALSSHLETLKVKTQKIKAWIVWAYMGIVGALGAVLGILSFYLWPQLTQMRQDLLNLNTLIASVEASLPVSPVTFTPTFVPEPTLPPTLEPTPTLPPIPEPNPPLLPPTITLVSPFARQVLTWNPKALDDIPSLQLQVAPGWTFTPSLSIQSLSYTTTTLLLFNSQLKVFTVTLSAELISSAETISETTDTNFRTIGLSPFPTLSGFFTVNDGQAEWEPDPNDPPLKSGIYWIQLDVFSDRKEIVWQERQVLPIISPLIITTTRNIVLNAPGDDFLGKYISGTLKSNVKEPFAYTLECVGWTRIMSPTMDTEIIYAKVRIPGKREYYWINITPGYGWAKVPVENIKHDLPELKFGNPGYPCVSPSFYPLKE